MQIPHPFTWGFHDSALQMVPLVWSLTPLRCLALSLSIPPSFLEISFPCLNTPLFELSLYLEEFLHSLNEPFLFVGTMPGIISGLSVTAALWVLDFLKHPA
ncbi:hypothetical protein HMPREF2896_01020 [Corynebacterium sp. HMSC069E04]|nr:hypothetical protein HMPREF2896_01020 [Corynebacterium sp. HMSC069E04]